MTTSNFPPSRMLATLYAVALLHVSIASADQAQNETTSRILQQVVFAQHCFWTGEMAFGGIEGVFRTEAGFYEGREVTRVWYDPEMVSLEELKREGVRAGVADRHYVPGENRAGSAEYFDEQRYRIAPGRDQKKQVQGTPLEGKPMTDYQATKVNAFVRKDYQKALRFLAE